MATVLDRSELNDLLTCSLCKGLYRDAHTILECMHTFCKSCILVHFHDNNVRGSIQCPQCNVNLGLYGHLTSKMIYDRDLQAIVDKVHPEFILFEKDEEVQHYKKLKIPLKSAVSNKRERDNSDSHEREKKRTKEGAGEEQQDATKKEKERVDTEFTVKLNPCDQCDESLRLPMLAKRLCKVSMAVRVLKIKKFVHKRLTDAEQQTVQPEDIELTYNGDVLLDENKLSYLKKDIEAALASKANIEFVYRRKKQV